MSTQGIIALFFIIIGGITLYFGFSISLCHLSYITDFTMGILVMPTGFVLLLIGTTMIDTIYRRWARNRSY
jgi:hypothetical protein